MQKLKKLLPLPAICGRHVEDRIFGGTDTALDEFTWTVQLAYQEGLNLNIPSIRRTGPPRVIHERFPTYTPLLPANYVIYSRSLTSVTILFAGDKFAFRCGGSLINERYTITGEIEIVQICELPEYSQPS